MGSSSSQGYSPSSQLPPLRLRKEMTNIEWPHHRTTSIIHHHTSFNNDNIDKKDNNDQYRVCWSPTPPSVFLLHSTITTT